MYKIDGSWSYMAAPWKWGRKPSLQTPKEHVEHAGCTQMACILTTLPGGEWRTASSSVVGDRHHSKRVWARRTSLSLNCSNPFRAVVGCVWHQYSLLQLAIEIHFIHFQEKHVVISWWRQEREHVTLIYEILQN